MSDHENYVATMTLLFSDEDWCNKISPELLPALVGANCIKNDFMCYAKTVSAMPCYDTSNYKILLTAAVNALDTYMNRKVLPVPDIEVIIKFATTLMTETGTYDEIFMLFLVFNI